MEKLTSSKVKHLWANEHHQESKDTIYKTGENICNPISGTGLVCRVYNELLQLNRKNTQFENGQMIRKEVHPKK